MMTIRKLLLFILANALFCQFAYARTPAPDGAELYFISPRAGETVSSPVTVRFGLKNMGVAPAGVQYDNTGHHHLLINVEAMSLDLPIINNEEYRHFGAGQTETVLNLEPGVHTLQLLLGDFAHIPHQPAVMSEQITITVSD